MEYEIAKADNVVGLEYEVKRRIREGWAPLGGLAIGMMFRPGPLTSIVTYCQAMTRGDVHREVHSK